MIPRGWGIPSWAITVSPNQHREKLTILRNIDCVAMSGKKIQMREAGKHKTIPGINQNLSLEYKIYTYLSKNVDITDKNL